MKNSFYIFFLLVVFQSCKLTDEKPNDETVNPQESKEVMKAIDKDENGCLASAGYIWSKLNKECVKLYTGIQLNPIDKPENEDETLSAYIMFNEDGDKAELFLPNATKTIVLTQEKGSSSWIFNDWKLIHTDGYELKQLDKTVFKGDDFIGQKVLGSDTEEK